MNSQKFCEILENHLCNSARRLSLGRRRVFQQDNDPKHTSLQPLSGSTGTQTFSSGLASLTTESNRKSLKRVEDYGLQIFEISSEYVSKNRGKCQKMCSGTSFLLQQSSSSSPGQRRTHATKYRQWFSCVVTNIFLHLFWKLVFSSSSFRWKYMQTLFVERFDASEIVIFINFLK